MKESLRERNTNENLSVLYMLLERKARAIEGAVQFPMEIGGNNLEVSFFGVEDEKLRFGLFVEGGKYSRKTIEVDRDGNVTEDTSGKMPESDLTDHEPDFSSVSDEDITGQVLSALIKELKVEPHQ